MGLGGIVYPQGTVIQSATPLYCGRKKGENQSSEPLVPAPEMPNRPFLINCLSSSMLSITQLPEGTVLRIPLLLTLFKAELFFILFFSPNILSVFPSSLKLWDSMVSRFSPCVFKPS